MICVDDLWHAPGESRLIHSIDAGRVRFSDGAGVHYSVTRNAFLHWMRSRAVRLMARARQ